MTEEESVDKKGSEIEYGGIKIRGGKILLIIPLLGTLGGAIWGGFEGYARWTAMEKKIESYVAPDISGLDKKVSVFEESMKLTEQSIENKVSVFEESIKLTEQSIQNFEDTIIAQEKLLKTEVLLKIENFENTINALEKKFDENNQSQEKLVKTEIDALHDAIMEAQDTVRDIRNDLKSEIHDMGDQIGAIDKRSREADRIVRDSIRTSETDVRRHIKESERNIKEDMNNLEKDLEKKLDKALNNPLSAITN